MLKMAKKRFIILLLLVFFVNLILRIYQYKDNYSKKFNPSYWEQRYLVSQWVVPNSKNSIGDDGLYAYAGYKYVHDGMNPILNSAEVPPLGKYLIGITILVFNNQNIFGLLTGVLSLVSFFFLNTLLFKNKVLALIPVVLFSLESLFWEQLQANYLDLLYLSFLMFVFIFAFKKKYVLSAIFIGCFAATKFPPTSGLVAISVLLYAYINHKKNLLRVTLSFILWPVIFIMSYFRFFMLGNGPLEFLKVLKYFLHYYQIGVKSEDHLMVFNMLLTGRWNTWWGSGVVHVNEWTLLWTVSFLISLCCIFYYKKLFKSPMSLIVNWTILYFAFLIIIPVAPRYLLLILPFLYNISVWVLSEGSGSKYLQRLGFSRFFSSLGS